MSHNAIEHDTADMWMASMDLRDLECPRPCTDGCAEAIKLQFATSLAVARLVGRRVDAVPQMGVYPVVGAVLLAKLPTAVEGVGDFGGK